MWNPYPNKTIFKDMSMKKFRAFLNRHPVAVTIVAVVVIALSTLSLVGCQEYVNDQGQTVTKLSDEATDTLDMAVELAPVVVDTLVGVSVAVPTVAGLLGILAGSITAFAGAYKKYRPQITAATDNATKAGETTKALVYGIEQFKETNGQDWDTLKVLLKDELLDKVGPEAFAVIQALIESYKEVDEV